MGGRTALFAAIVAAALAVAAAPAQADHHEVRIVEVSAGGAATFQDWEYVQLEMTLSGQRFFGGTNSFVTLFGSDGDMSHMEPVSTNVANGERGRAVLIGSDSLPTVTPDFEWEAENHLDLSGGAACFESGTAFGPIDCVSWGSYDATPPPPSPTGGNALPIPDGLALVRRRPPCGPGVIDTDSPADLTSGGANPRTNANPPATGDPCPNTTLTKKPKKRTTQRRATFEFNSSINPATFECKLDSTAFTACNSPFRKRVKRGKHTFRVKATAGGATDPTPASYGWKVVRPKRR
jgi:hypothetical protein